MGRRAKPFYRDLLTNLLGNATGSRFIAHVTSLFLESEIAAQSGPALTRSDGPGSINNAGVG